MTQMYLSDLSHTVLVLYALSHAKIREREKTKKGMKRKKGLSIISMCICWNYIRDTPLKCQSNMRSSFRLCLIYTKFSIKKSKAKDKNSK